MAKSCPESKTRLPRTDVTALRNGFYTTTPDPISRKSKMGPGNYRELPEISITGNYPQITLPTILARFSPQAPGVAPTTPACLALHLLP